MTTLVIFPCLINLPNYCFPVFNYCNTVMNASSTSDFDSDFSEQEMTQEINEINKTLSFGGKTPISVFPHLLLTGEWAYLNH